MDFQKIKLQAKEIPGASQVETGSFGHRRNLRFVETAPGRHRPIYLLESVSEW